MMKKWLSLILAVLMLLALAPAALAEGEDPPPEPKLTASGASVAYGETAKVTAKVENGEGYKIEYSVDGGSWSETVPTRTEPGKSTVQIQATKEGATTLTASVTLEVGEKPAEPKLTASGASVAYGETAKVTAKVENGEGYKIEYSVDGGSWSETVPTRTEPGKSTVQIQATKEGATTLTASVTLEVGEKPAEPKLTASGASVAYGETAKVTAKVENGEGYSIEYSTDGGTTWIKTTPTRTEPGETVVQIRALKDGATTLTASATLKVGDKPAVKTTLTAHGGTFPYDGKAHAVTYTLENGDGYTVRFSTDGGSTWINKAPSLTDVGKLTVKVEAAKSGAETLTVQVVLEVTQAAADGSTVTIVNCKSFVNVRAKATSKSTKLGTAKKGKTFKLLAVEGNWYKIQYTADKVGYVYSSYGKVGKGTAPAPDPAPGPVAGDKAYIVKVRYQVNVRKKATSKSTKLGTLKLGSEVTVTGTSGNWTQIAYKDGIAYVFSQYVSATKPDTDVVGKKATIVNCKSFVNVREKASSASKKLGIAKKGATYTVKGLSGNWVQVDYDGKTAFIYKRYVKIG